MAHLIRGDLNITRALQFNADEGASGQLIQGLGGATPQWIDIADLKSDDAGNDIIAGTDGKLKLIETVTSMTYDAPSTLLTFHNEAGGTDTVDLSALTTDIYVDGASFNPTSMVLTLTDNDGETPNVTIDLSTLRGSFTGPTDNIYTYDDGSGTTFDIDIRAGVSPNAGNDLTADADGLPYWAESETSLTYTGGVLTYDREVGANQVLALYSTDSNNRLSTGDADSALFVRAIQSKSTFNATTDWGAAAGGVYTLTKTAATFHNSNADAIVQIQSGSAAPFETSVALNSCTVNADGSVTMKVPETPDGRFFGRVVYIA